MKKLYILLIFSLTVFCSTELWSQDRPNVVIIYADDMGFSDVGAYGDMFNTPSPASTPNMDALATEGMLFTQAHSGSAVCTPSRYSLLTGKFSWRNIEAGVSNHFGEPEMIDEDVTLPEYLKSNGYQTAAFGKWHLGGTFFNRNGAPYTGRRVIINDPNDVDWERQVEGHAVDHGFDVFKGLAASINFPPYVYMDGDRVQYFDTGTNQYRNALNSDNYQNFTASQLDDGLMTIYRDGRTGLGDPAYKQAEAGPILIDEVENYVEGQVGNSKPFFVYASLYSPHKPWHVTSNFANSEGFQYGDFMHEVDHRIGRIIDAIDDAGFSDNTIIIITSDNGPEGSAVENSLENGKDSNGHLNGMKRESWEGGTRVPFIIRWPGVVQPNSVSDQLIWHGDIYKTLIDYFDDCQPEDVASDGASILPILDGSADWIVRPPVVNASSQNQLSIKASDGWKLIDGTAGGGRPYSFNPDNIRFENANGEVGGDPKQLFNLSTDVGEQNNLINTEADKGQELLTLLEEIQEEQYTSIDFASTFVPTQMTTVAAGNSKDSGLSGDFVIRERRPSNNNANRHISGFVKFNISSLDNFNSSNGDRAFIEAKVKEKLNQVHESTLYVGSVKGGNWSSTQNIAPDYKWATKSQSPIGPGSQGDEGILISDIRKVSNYSYHSLDVSAIVQKWKDGTQPNYGFGLYLSDESNGISLEDIKLTVYQSGNEPCQSNISPVFPNLALNKSTNQSSTSGGGNADRAVDGNTNGNYKLSSVTHTKGNGGNGTSNPWWRVDLGAVYHISKISVFNRTNCCMERLDGAKVYVGTNESTNPSQYTEVGVLNDGFIQSFTALEVSGRYVMIQIPGNGKILSLAEVQVFGSAIDASATLYKHCNYGGSNVSLGIGEYPNMPSVGLLKNDISSLRVPAGLQVTLFNNTNFRGSSITFTADDNCLINNSFNDKTGSFIIESLGAVARSAASELIIHPAFGQKANLKWYFFQEVDKKVKQYLIKYSSDEQQQMKELAIIPAEDTEGVLSYEYLHHTPEVGPNYYQVIVQFEDGTENYQLFGDINFEKKEDYLIVAPNPAQDYLKVDLSNYMNKPIDYFIQSIDGKILLEGKLSNDHDDTIEINLSKITNGLYIIYLKPENRRAVAVKFVIAKDY